MADYLEQSYRRGDFKYSFEMVGTYFRVDTEAHDMAEWRLEKASLDLSESEAKQQEGADREREREREKEDKNSPGGLLFALRRSTKAL